MSHFSNLFLQKLHLVYERLGQKDLPCFFQFLPRSLLRICEKPSSWESSCDLGLEGWIIAYAFGTMGLEPGHGGTIWDCSLGMTSTMRPDLCTLLKPLRDIGILTVD